VLERGITNAAVAAFWDPVVAEQAFAAGEGAKLKVRLGGKLGPTSGDPLDLSVRVRSLVPGLLQRWPQANGYLEVPCGDAACLTCDGVDIIVESVRQQVFGLEVLTAFGISPLERDLIVVKSTNHFRTAFEPVASEILYMSAPGALTLDFRSIAYRRMNTRKYPFVEDPWADA
jgi:microcystin degradation protein MlrC